MSDVTSKLFDFDLLYGANKLAGMDEAGRGPLAGPVVVACCIMPLDEMIDKINDSKKVSEKTREKLFETIVHRATYTVKMVSAETIDEINILNATKSAMKDCIYALEPKPDITLIDAVKLDLPYTTVSLIKGDAKSYNIAAASIIAKVTRDRIMRELDEKYPMYGFARNKGYGTAEHIAALKKYGPCPEHRRTFIKHFVEV